MIHRGEHVVYLENHSLLNRQEQKRPKLRLSLLKEVSRSYLIEAEKVDDFTLQYLLS